MLESAVKHATEDLAKLHKKPIGGAKNGGSREVSSVKVRARARARVALRVVGCVWWVACGVWWQA